MDWIGSGLDIYRVARRVVISTLNVDRLRAILHPSFILLVDYPSPWPSLASPNAY